MYRKIISTVSGWIEHFLSFLRQGCQNYDPLGSASLAKYLLTS